MIAFRKDRKLGADVLDQLFSRGSHARVPKGLPKGSDLGHSGRGENLYICYHLGLLSLYSPSYSSLQVPEEDHGWTLVDAEIVQAAHRRGVAVVPLDDQYQSPGSTDQAFAGREP